MTFKQPCISEDPVDGKDPLLLKTPFIFVIKNSFRPRVPNMVLANSDDTTSVVHIYYFEKEKEDFF